MLRHQVILTYAGMLPYDFLNVFDFWDISMDNFSAHRIYCDHHLCVRHSWGEPIRTRICQRLADMFQKFRTTLGCCINNVHRPHGAEYGHCITRYSASLGEWSP